MRRFMVVRYDWLHDPAGVPVHNLLGEYHGVSLDYGHMLILGHVNLSTIMTLEQHPHALLMPSIFSSKTIEHHATQRQKCSFCIPLRECLSLQPHHQVMHLAEIAHNLHGRIFALDV